MHTVDRKNFARKKIFEFNPFQEYLCVAKLGKSVVHGCKWSEERIFKTRRSRSIGLSFVREIRILLDATDVWNDVGMCAGIKNFTACSRVLVCCLDCERV
jgi:hypothetical protein